MIWENVMAKMSNFLSLKISILKLCIMRLNWFYYKTSTAVHKQFIPNPSITFKCKFPFFWDVSNSTSAINCTLHSYFCFVQWNSVMPFYVKFNFWFNVWLQATSLDTILNSFVTRAVLSDLHAFSNQWLNINPLLLFRSWMHAAYRHTPWLCLQ